MIDRIHDHAAHMRASSLPARASSFAAGNVHVIDIADLADGRVAVLRESGGFRLTAFSPARNRLRGCSTSPAGLRCAQSARRVPASARYCECLCRAESRAAEVHYRDPAAHRRPPSPARRRAVRPARECNSVRHPSYLIRAMRAERFGSYSIAITSAATPRLRRLKSTLRYFCLWPPPM